MSYLFALDVIRQAAKGLSHIHNRQIVHRDFKPSNVLLRTDGVVKVIDMGLAKAKNDEFEGLDPARLLGTAEYVSPEQILDSRTANAQSDLYSLGCTFYFLLTGQAPYPGKDVDAQLAAHQIAPIPDPRAIRHDCPTGLVDLLTRLLAKKPQDRPRSAKELVRQIDHLRISITERLKVDEMTPPGETVIDE